MFWSMVSEEMDNGIMFDLQRLTNAVSLDHRVLLPKVTTTQMNENLGLKLMHNLFATNLLSELLDGAKCAFNFKSSFVFGCRVTS